MADLQPVPTSTQELKAYVTQKERIWQIISFGAVGTLIIFLLIRAEFFIDYKWIFGFAVIFGVAMYFMFYQKKAKQIDLDSIPNEIREQWGKIACRWLDTTKSERHWLGGNEYLFSFPQDMMVFWYEVGRGIKGYRKDTLDAVISDINNSKLASKLVELGVGKGEVTEQLKGMGFQIP